MGEANRKTKRLLLGQPDCTYCAGSNPSSSRDHCPPISAFNGRWRPEGLEFGACHECHQGTREMDEIVAFASRIYSRYRSPEHQKDVGKYASSFIRRHPKIAATLKISRVPVLYRGAFGHEAVIAPDSPIHRVLEAFGARMALALYRSLKGKPAPSDADISSLWLTNTALDENAELETLLKAMGKPSALVQGAKNTGEQFRYWSGTAREDDEMFGCFAAFRESFGIVAFVDAREKKDDLPSHYKPGFLQGFDIYAET